MYRQPKGWLTRDISFCFRIFSTGSANMDALVEARLAKRLTEPIDQNDHRIYPRADGSRYAGLPVDLDDEGIAGALGVIGYDMGGGHALTVAGRHPHRFVAAASFHAANLPSVAPVSPHLRAD
jgi:hypothetical protein